MRVAIYARVSTANNGQDPTMQTRELHEYCEPRGWTLTGEYVDVGISGTKERRPELDHLMVDAHRRRFDVVAVWTFDRMARSVSHLLRALETFNSLGIEFVSLSESLDTSTPAGKMVFTVLGAVAELERSLIVERVMAGLRNAKAKGKRLGRPQTVVDVRKVATLREQGRSWPQIAKQLGIGVGMAYRAHQELSKNLKAESLSRIPSPLPSAVDRFIEGCWLPEVAAGLSTKRCFWHLMSGNPCAQPDSSFHELRSILRPARDDRSNLTGIRIFFRSLC
jgi:DNA invertase Pin-like site-specific DNA recombinase